MDIVVPSNKSLFQQTFQKKLRHFNRNSQFRSVMRNMIQFDFRSRSWTKNSTPTPSVVKNPTPPKNLRLLATPQPCSICQRFNKTICIMFNSFCWWCCFVYFKQKLHRIAKSS